MKLLDLHISGFGKFHDRDIRFSDGVNIICGQNEAGKSTLHTFIRCMLFGLERGRGRASRNDLYSRCEPWFDKSNYGGRLRFEQDGIIYRIERNFQKDQKSLTIVNETDGKTLEPTGALMNKLLCGLTETTYSNTISIGQLKSATDDGMVSELRNYIANMNTSGSMALNITRAVSLLRARRKEFDRQLDADAARNYTTLLGEIRNIEKELAAPEYENHLSSCRAARTEVQELLSRKQEERESLLQKTASAKQALASAQFTDQASIETYLSEAKGTWFTYTQAKSTAGRPLRTVAAVLALLLAAAAGAGATLQYTSRFDLTASFAAAILPETVAANLPATTAAFFLAVPAAALLCLSLGLFWQGSRLKHETAMTGKILQEMFSRHLGDQTISDEAMQAFEARMQEYIRLAQVVEVSESSLQEQAAGITSLRQKQADCDEALAKQQRAQWDLEKKLEHLAHCKDQVESLKRILAENERIREEIAAIDLALDTMTGLSSSIRDSFGLYLNKTASDMVGGITGGVYDSMSVDENLNVFMNTREKLVPVSQVSSGTMDQVYLALRLAAAKLLQTGHDTMPLIFDDSFALYDDERLRAALKWLATSWDGQIIIFTCHQREAQLLTANRIPYHLIRL